MSTDTAKPSEPLLMRKALWRVPRSVWMLGLVSLFMDTSSEMIHALLPLFLVSTLGASVVLVGAIEGVAEATAAIVKVFSGTLSDARGARKPLVVAGYGLAALTKPFFPLATTPFMVFAARFADRIGKGLRGAPRDALIADITPEGLRGTAFGLRQALDTVGAVAGPLAAFALMAGLGNIRAVFWWAALPALFAVAILVLGVKEPARPQRRPLKMRIAWRRAAHLGRAVYFVMILGALFALARFSEAFLILKAAQAGLPTADAPLALVVMNSVYALSAVPAGLAADRFGGRGLLALGISVLLVSDLVLAAAHGPGLVFLGIGLWGLSLGLTQGLLSALLADAAPARFRGTAFGLFNLVSGLALLLASLLAGALWQAQGAAATFYAGAGFSLLALLALGLGTRASRAS